MLIVKVLTQPDHTPIAPGQHRGNSLFNSPVPSPRLVEEGRGKFELEVDSTRRGCVYVLRFNTFAGRSPRKLVTDVCAAGPIQTKQAESYWHQHPFEELTMILDWYKPATYCAVRSYGRRDLLRNEGFRFSLQGLHFGLLAEGAIEYAATSSR